jgi:hypothetical protein
MQCPGLSNAYMKTYTVLGRRYKHQLKKKATLQIIKIWLKKAATEFWCICWECGSTSMVGVLGCGCWYSWVDEWSDVPGLNKSEFWCWPLICTDPLCKVHISASNSMSFTAFSAILRCMGCRYFNLFPHTLPVVKYSPSSTAVVFHGCFHSTDGKSDTPPLHLYSDWQSPLHSAWLKLGFKKKSINPSVSFIIHLYWTLHCHPEWQFLVGLSFRLIV